MYIGPEFQALVRALRAEATTPLLTAFARPTLALKALRRQSPACLELQTTCTEKGRHQVHNWDGQTHGEPDWTSEPQGTRSLQMDSTLPGTQAADTNKDRKSQGAGNGYKRRYNGYSTGRTGKSEEDGLQTARQLRQASISCPLDLQVTSPYHLGSPQHSYMAKQ